MTKPEEKLRDRIADIIFKNDSMLLHKRRAFEGIALGSYLYKEASQSIIDEILKPQLEFISNDTVPVEGDLLRIDSWVHTAVSREIYADMGKLYGKRAHFTELAGTAKYLEMEANK